jgi:osmoprotectant transport system permease protein
MWERSLSAISGLPPDESFPRKLLAGHFVISICWIFAAASIHRRDSLGFVASRGGCCGHVILGFRGALVTNYPVARITRLACTSPLFCESAFARNALRFFCTVCCRSCAAPATGLQDIPRSLRESAVALGLSAIARLWKIYLPIASRSILSGIKTSAVINIGTATLAALIGAGGLGEPIISGLNLNDHMTILEGCDSRCCARVARAMVF